MPITYPEGPAQGPDVVNRHLQDILGSPAGAGVLKGHRAREASLTAPHRSYFVRLDEVAKGNLLKVAQPVAWRYLLYIDDEIAEVEISDEEPPKEPEFIGFFEGPFGAATDRALDFAKSLRKVKTNDYELRYLKIPSVYFAAIWLHGEQDDILIPLHNPPGGLKEDQAYAERRVVNSLAGVARRALAFDRKSSRRKPK